MARQNMRPVPYLKHMEAYNNFAGGLNTVTSNDNLRNNEFPDLTNVDLAERGSVKRRSGMSRQLTAPVAGVAQGYFRFFKTDGTFDEILAIGGKLYKNGVQLPITNLASFQTTRQIEAVQFRDKLYIATGTKLVEYDGTTAKVIVPYTPQPLEALYIGTNALADNPDSFITDGTSSLLRIDGITSNKRIGIANITTTFTAYVSKPAGTVEYKWEYKKLSSDTWSLLKDFTADQKTMTFTQQAGEYEIRCSARMSGTTQVEEYYLPEYRVTPTDQNKTNNTTQVHQCNRILLHWNRLIMYGDPTQPDMIYITDLNRPDYVPTLSTLKFENERREGLTALVEFRDMLVAFTPNSIQALYGKSPEDYSRVMLSSAVGCIAPYSAKVMENYVTFLSQEGIHILKALGYTESRMNVQKIDDQIGNIVPRDKDACAIVADGQYQVTFPTRKKRFRYYYQMGGVWTKDESDKLDFIRMYEWGGDILGQSKVDANILKMDSSVMTDDGHVYTDSYKFKDYDFSEPYNPKKLKELQLLLAHFPERVHLRVYVFADDGAILNPDTSRAEIVNGQVVWVVENNPNLELGTGTALGSWIMGDDGFGPIQSEVHKLKISGKCRRVRLEIVHDEATPNHILGVGFIFKSKKP